MSFKYQYVVVSCLWLALSSSRLRHGGRFNGDKLKLEREHILNMG